MCVILHMSVITQDGHSALMWAAMWGETEVVVELVEAGANVDMQDKVYVYVNAYTCTFTYSMYWVHSIVCTCTCVSRTTIL